MKKLSKRTFRNTVMVLIIAILAFGSYFTLTYDSSQKAQFSPPAISQSDGQSDFQPPEMPSGDSQNSNAKPPEMPNGDSQNSNAQPPEMPNGDSQNSNAQPPEMPSGDNQNANGETGSTQSESSDSNTQNRNQLPQMPGNGQMPQMPGRSSKSSLRIILTALTAAQCLLAAAIIIYLIMSGFNKKGFKETLKGWKRIVIYVLSTIIIATSITAIETAVFKQQKGMNPPGMSGMMQGEMPGGSSSTVDASGATTVDGKDETLAESYSSTESDESAILVTNGGNAVISGAKISKTGDTTNTESSEFNGVNAAVLVQSGSTATVTDANITTDAKGANAVFATGENAKIYIKNSTITSSGESSARGLDATYGGYIEADNVTITTQGGSCASLATDRGEGTVIAKNSTLETNGSGSPVIYSTGDISVENTTGTANGSQNIVIEGKNSATVTNSTLSASGKGNRKDVDRAGVMIYQSMSGDASEGTGTLNATDSTLEIQSDSDYYKTAPMFFVTNTDAQINLENTKLVFGSGVLLNAAATSEWGNSGSNGGNVTLNAKNQTLAGNITADSISTVTLNLTSSSFEGAINADNSAKEITLKLDKSSKIKLTGDTYVTSLDDEDSTYSSIDFNGFTLYVNGKAIK